MSELDRLERKRARLTPEQLAALERRLAARPVVEPPQPAPPPSAPVRDLGGAPALSLPWDAVVAAGERAAEPVPGGGVSATTLNALLDELAVAAIAGGLRAAGAYGTDGEVHDADELGARLGLDPDRGRLLRRCMLTLEAAGVLVPAPAGLAAPRALREAPLDPLAAEVRALTEGTPYQALAEAVVLGATRFADILLGRLTGQDVFFAGGDGGLAERAYSEPPEARQTLRVLAAMVAAVQAGAPRERPLRVLELGAGLGIATAVVLPLLGPGTAYLFTDVSSYFLDRALGRFGGTSAALDVAIADLDSEVPAAGVAPGSFDMVVAAASVHCARSVPRALGHARAALRSGGLLVLVEPTEPRRWHDVSTALISGLPDFEDERAARCQPFLGAGAWLSALRGARFEPAHAVPARDAEGRALGHHVLAAIAA
jgi:pyochelin synthetase